MPSLTALPTIRRELRDRDPEAIADLHDRVYRAEYGLGPTFTASVANSVRIAVERGWPATAGGAWLIDGDRPGTLSGALGLTEESPGVGRLRWFVFESHLRGHGLGRLLIEQLLGEARSQQMRRLELETFSALRAAAQIYRSAGFEVTASSERHDWGAPITYQHYALEL